MYACTGAHLGERGRAGHSWVQALPRTPLPAPCSRQASHKSSSLEAGLSWLVARVLCARHSGLGPAGGSCWRLAVGQLGAPRRPGRAATHHMIAA